ncbi:hypothetical protein PhCBS80983_g02605 [Powellomyces hirtus]|uniref:Uncharacterized protein n=1 Tax=Powellomyces hirtus TaxID=109895 RepID=A0A507E804_9FUNG|nr:hypothetical protein PhCBS80983_g02605 [Powellomyces hirtus]
MFSAASARILAASRCGSRTGLSCAQRTVQLRHSSIAVRAASYPYPLWIIPQETDRSAISVLAPEELEGNNGNVIVGWAKGLPKDSTDLKPAGFTGNSEFEDVLHDVLKQHISEDVGAQGLAMHQKLGYLNINDERSYAPFGRVSDPEDILGTCRLDDGKIVPGSYERMPTHRIVSGNGLFQLSEYIHEKLVARLRKQ